MALPGMTFKLTGLAFLLGVLVLSGQAYSQMPDSVEQSTCEGELVSYGDTLSVGGCGIKRRDVRAVTQVCSLGQQCLITGILEHCPGVRGACAEFKKITKIRRGAALPVCRVDAAIQRANKWWRIGASVIVKGTIIRAPKERRIDTASYGFNEIIVDLTTCSNGAPMYIDRVPDKWIGRFVEVGGIASKDGNTWFISATSIESAN
jgi:hypothetical protein